MRKILLFCLLFLISCEKKDDEDDHSSGPGIFYEEVFVSPDGDDQGKGTVDQPWKNISIAASRLGPGATLTILEGTYTVGTRLKISGITIPD
jgi:hypothetical protein